MADTVAMAQNPEIKRAALSPSDTADIEAVEEGVCLRSGQSRLGHESCSDNDDAKTTEFTGTR